ncbi:MAG: hypothetical protein GKR99_16185 [Rhodobacteraceae bacterium]|nr:hypothetical protein [Paracoccaceae bacterium]
MSSWWPLDKHSLSAGDGKVARDVRISPEVGGNVTETKHDGTEVVWGKVVTWQPGKSFAMTWQLDRPEDEVTYLTINFDPDGTGTRVTLIHDGWNAIPQAAQAARSHYSTGWDYVLCDRFKSAAE